MRISHKQRELFVEHILNYTKEPDVETFDYSTDISIPYNDSIKLTLHFSKDDGNAWVMIKAEGVSFKYNWIEGLNGWLVKRAFIKKFGDLREETGKPKVEKKQLEELM